MKLKDWLLLLIPVAVLIAAIPFLPEKIPMQWSADGSVNWYLSRYYFFIVGVLPFLLYKSMQAKKGKK